MENGLINTRLKLKSKETSSASESKSWGPQRKRNIANAKSIFDDSSMASQNQPPLPQPELVTSSVSSRPKEQRTLQTSRSNRSLVSFFDDLTKPKMEKQIQQRQHAKDIASKNLSRVEARDINAMKLLSTEEAYNAKLEHLIRAREGLIPFCSSTEIEALFSNIKEIKEFSDLLIQEFIQVISVWNEESCLGDTFKKLGKSFEVYEPYYTNHSQALQCLETCLKRENVDNFCRTNEKVWGQDIKTLLELPAQRMKRYVELLRDLLNATPSTHRDRSLLVEGINTLPSFFLQFAVEEENLKRSKLSPPKYSEEQASIIIQKNTRRWLAKKHYKTILSQYKRRQKIVEEILNTEQTYVKSLEIVVDIYMKPLRTNQMISEKSIKTIFSELPIILCCNKYFLNLLNTRLKNYDAARSTIADTFFIIVDYVEAYSWYVRNFNQSHLALHSCIEQNPQFKEFLQNCRITSGTNLDLEDYLIMPVQRIPRYTLLLQDLKKSTWESHPDYPLICSSIERITDAYKSFKVKEIQETEEKPSSAVGNLRSKFKKLRSASARDLKEESVPTSQTIKILEKDETLFKVLTIAMRGMLIKEDNITGILTIIEECIQDKPSKARTLNTMEQLHEMYEKFRSTSKEESAAIKIQSGIRGWKARKRFNNLKRIAGPNWQVRRETFKELLNTERNYVKQLNVIIQNYSIPLHDLQKKKAFPIEISDLNAIFINVDTLAKIHQSWVQKFLEVYEKWPLEDTLGDLFLKLAKTLHDYGEFVKNFKHAVDTLNRCTQDSRFSALLESYQQNSDSELDLHTLLSCPLNRLSQYKFHLEILVKNTSTTHPDYVNLVNAYSMMTRLSEWIQNGLEEASNLSRLLNVKRRIELSENDSISAFEIFDNFSDDIYGSRRKYIKEGICNLVRSKESRRKKTRYLFLFNDVLLFTKPHLKDKFRFKGYVKFDKKTKLEKGPDAHQLLLICKDEKIYIILNTENDFNDWQKYLYSVVDNIVHRDEKIFGISLIELMSREDESKIPSFIQNIQKAFDSRESEVKAIFNTPMLTSNQEHQLKKKFDSDKISYDSVSLRELLSLLKIFLSNLPDPLVSYDLMPGFLEVVKAINKDSEEAIAFMVSLLKKVPLLNRIILESILRFLKKSSTSPDPAVRKMNIAKLSVIFGRSLIRPAIETMEYTIQIPEVNRVVQFLITNVSTIFERLEEELLISIRERSRSVVEGDSYPPLPVSTPPYLASSNSSVSTSSLLSSSSKNEKTKEFSTVGRSRSNSFGSRFEDTFRVFGKKTANNNNNSNPNTSLP